MYLDFNEKGKVKVDMKYCIKKMIEQYPRHVKPFKCLWNEKLFLTNKKSPALSKEDREVFHSAVMQGIFLVKRGRPVAEPAFSYFSTRVKCSAEQDRSKLEKTLDSLLFAIEPIEPNFDEKIEPNFDEKIESNIDEKIEPNFDKKLNPI